MGAHFMEPESQLELILVRGPDDGPLSSKEYQDGLAELAKSLRAQGSKLITRFHDFDAIGAADLLSGEFILKVLAPGAAAVLGAWLHARYGRKVRLKVGEIEAEAQSVEDVEKLLARVQEIQHSNQPKVIHER